MLKSLTLKAIFTDFSIYRSKRVANNHDICICTYSIKYSTCRNAFKSYVQCLQTQILYYMFTMIYGEILKTGEIWLSMLSALTFHGLFNADSKLPKNYMDNPETFHLEKVNFNP